MRTFHSLNVKQEREAVLITILISFISLAGCNRQTVSKVFHVGILYETVALDIAADGFREKMTELGYIEGNNIEYDMQLADNNPTRNRRIAEEFVEKKVDLIFAFPLIAALAAKEATEGTGIPVVFTIAGIEGNTLVDSVREPGNNITGVRSPITELPTKSFEIMLELVPRLKRIYTTYAADYPAVLPGIDALRSLAKSKGVTVVEVPVTSLEMLKVDLREREETGDIGLDAIILLPETLVQTPEGFALINTFAARHRVPIGGLIPWEVKAGAVFTSGIDMREMGRLAAPLADKIFKGIKAGTIPVVSPELHLYINYKLAQELGIEIPKGLLLQAVEIIR